MLLHTAPITPENLMSASPHSNDLNHLYAALSQPGTLLELGALAWFLARGGREEKS